MEYKILKHEAYQMEVGFKVDSKAVRVSKDKITKEYKISKKPLPPLEKLMKMAYKDTMHATFNKFLRETNYLNLNQPRFKINQAHPAKGLDFQMRVAVHPPVELPNYQEIEMEVPEIPIPSEKLLMSKLNQLRNEVAEEQEVQRAVRQDDKIIVNYVLLKDGSPIPLTSRTRFEDILTPNLFFPGFGERLEGMVSGETREFEVTLPEDFYDKPLRNQTATCRITLLQVFELSLPPLSHDFPKQYFDLDMDYEGFMEHIYNRLLEDHQKAWLKAVKRELLSLVVENTSMKIPKALVENILKSAWEELDGANLKEQNLDANLLNASQKSWLSNDTIRQQYFDKVKQSLIINAIALKENLKVKPGDLLAILGAWSQILDRPQEELYVELQETAQLSGIMDQIMAEKVLSFLGTKARLICNGEVITPEVV